MELSFEQFLWVLYLVSSVNPSEQQNETNTVICGGSIPCPAGIPCRFRLTTNSKQTELTLVEELQCTQNAVCDSEFDTCRCKEGFSRTSKGYCEPTFNASCLESLCNEEEHLICSNGTGRCGCPLEGTHFSPLQGACVASAGASCSELLYCTDNALCSMLDWSCYCKNGFSVLNPEGTCRPSYGSFCSLNETSLACNSNEFLECVDEECTCEKGLVWEETLEKCMFPVGQGCDLKLTVDMTQVSACLPPARCVLNPNSVDTRKGVCQKCRSGDEDNACEAYDAAKTTSLVFIHYILIVFHFTVLSFFTTE